MVTAKIYKDKRDYVVDVDGRIYRGEKISESFLPDGRVSIRVYDPAWSFFPRSRARMYHNDITVIADRVERYA